jgi:hypothetical protein
METAQSPVGPWQTLQLSPSLDVLPTACESAAWVAWQAVQSAVVRGMGLIVLCGIFTAFKPTGRFCSELFTWHISQ